MTTRKCISATALAAVLTASGAALAGDVIKLHCEGTTWLEPNTQIPTGSTWKNETRLLFINKKAGTAAIHIEGNAVVYEKIEVSPDSYSGAESSGSGRSSFSVERQSLRLNTRAEYDGENGEEISVYHFDGQCSL